MFSSADSWLARAKISINIFYFDLNKLHHDFVLFRVHTFRHCGQFARQIEFHLHSHRILGAKAVNDGQIGYGHDLFFVVDKIH